MEGVAQAEEMTLFCASLSRERLPEANVLVFPLGYQTSR